MKRDMFYIAIILVLAGIILIWSYQGSQENYKGEALVARVIDGDTVELGDGERVRLLGIDTPEKGQFFYQEAMDWLAERIEGKKVRLESGHENRDKYDRLLRYIYIEGVLVNLELVQKGYASSYIFEEDQHSEEIRNLEQLARRERLGIWSIETDNAFCLGIHFFHYNAVGNDNENLNDEYVTFRNKCTETLDITGWVLFDERNTIYRFPDTIAMNKATVTVHTGEGENNETDLFWGNSIAIWNNDGDTLTMLDSRGNTMLEYSY